LLFGDVELVGGVRCGKKACWYVTRQEATFLTKVVDLESGTNSAIPTILTQNRIELLAAIDSALVFSHPSGVVAVRRSGGTVVMEEVQSFTEPRLRWGLTASGAIVWTTGGDLSVLSARGDSSVSLTCDHPLALSTAGDRVNVLCANSGWPIAERSLWSGTIEDGLQSIAVGTPAESEVPFLPSGDDELIGFTMAKDLEPIGRFVVTDGKDRREFPGLLAGEVARVRAGYVFAATRESVVDAELWVLPASPSGCGCSGGGGTELMLLLGVLLLRRRSTVG
jgi:hypothetical protein